MSEICFCFSTQGQWEKYNEEFKLFQIEFAKNIYIEFEIPKILSLNLISYYLFGKFIES